jgi:hypothetical protein
MTTVCWSAVSYPAPGNSADCWLIRLWDRASLADVVVCKGFLPDDAGLSDEGLWKSCNRRSSLQAPSLLSGAHVALANRPHTVGHCDVQDG